MITGWMLRTWLAHQRAMKQLSLTTQGEAPSEQPMQRVEQAIESVAIEVERISEGQRFVTKLLTERAQTVPRATGVS